MKPTKRQITYLQSFGKSFKPVRKYDSRAIKKWITSCTGLPHYAAFKREYAERRKEQNNEVLKIFKTASCGPTVCAPIDCGIDMVTINQLNRNILMKSVQCGNTMSFMQFIGRSLRVFEVNFESMENPEQVEC